jgi:hypothetical protein
VQYYAGAIGNFGATCSVDFSYEGQVELFDYNSNNPYLTTPAGQVDQAPTETTVLVHAGSRLVVLAPTSLSWGPASVQINSIQDCSVPVSPGSGPADYNMSNPHYLVTNVAATAAQGRLACANNEFGRVDQWWPCNYWGEFSVWPTSIWQNGTLTTGYNIVGYNSVSSQINNWDDVIRGGTVVQAVQNSTSPSQLWQLRQQPQGLIGGPESAGLQIVNTVTGMCVGWGAMTQQTPLTTAPCNGSASQEWMFLPLNRP